MDLKNKLFPYKEKIEYFDSLVPELVSKLSELEMSLNESVSNVHREWQQKRTLYLRTTLKLNTLRHVIEESDSSKAFQKLSLKDQQKLTEINHNLRMSDEKKVNGISQHTTPTQRVNKKLVELVKTEMKIKLLNTCSELLLHYYSLSDANGLSTRNVAVLYQKALELAALIKNDLTCVESVRIHRISKFDDRTDMNTEKQKKQRLNDHLIALNQIVDMHLIDSVPKENETSVDHLRAKAKTLEMKMKSVEEEVRCMTYTKEACAELERIRRKILAKTESVQCEVDQLDKQLAEYKSFSNSSSYELLVEQYGRLKAEIEGKMWALKELKDTEGISGDFSTLD